MAVEETGALVGEAAGEAVGAAATAGAELGTLAGFATGFGELAVGAAVIGGAAYEGYKAITGSKRDHSLVHTGTGPVTPQPPKRPKLPPRTPVTPGPRRAGPERRNFGPMAPKGSGRGGVKRGPRAAKSMRPATRKRKQAKPSRNTKTKVKGGQKAVRLRKTGLNKSAMAAANHTQVHGVVLRNEVSWFGFQSHGGAAELFDVLADGILRRLLARFKIVVPSPDSNMLDLVPQAVPSVNSFNISMRRADADTDGTVTTAAALTIDLTPSNGTGPDSNTYKSIVDTFATHLKAKAVEGFFPTQLQAFNSSGTRIYQDMRFGSAFIDMSVYTVLKMRNITPNDDGKDDMSAMSTNPLDGKLYTLNGDVPRLREDVQEGLGQKFNDHNVMKAFYDATWPEGINWGPQGTSYSDTNPNGMRRAQNDILSTPVDGKRVFQRVLSERKVIMAPGSTVRVPFLFKHKGTLENLLKRFAGVYASPGLGTVKLFCLQQTFKAQHGVFSTSHYHDHVKVEYEIDRWARCGCALASQRRIPMEKKVISSNAGADQVGTN